ncbi:hypothetical protein [Pseudomonas syringae]|nr:hypothetical protein [Pseudomonas syringae]
MGGYYISPFLSLAKILRWLIPLALIIIVANNKSELSAAVNTLMG